MKTTRFFRYLWRINGLLIFVAALLAVGVLAFMAIQFTDFGRHAPQQVVQVNAKPEEKPEPPTLGTFLEVRGTPFLRAPLTFGDQYRYAKFSSAGGAYSIRNYLFVNLETTEGTWLFPTDKQLIADSDELCEVVQKDGSSPPELRPLAFSYQIIDRDTNGDSQLTPDDKVSLAYTRPDGRGYTNVIIGIGRILGANTIEHGTKHVVVYEAGGKRLTAVISLRTFTVEKQGELPTSASTIRATARP